MSRPLPPDVERWRASGTRVEVLGRQVFVREVAPQVAAGAPVVVLHGFPGSSYDWAGVVEALAAQRRVLALDLPGYGLSSKDPDHDYSLFVQADVVESLLARRGVERCVLVAHDMGDTVAAELLARHDEGRLGCEVEQVVLTNGSILIDRARLTRGQRLTLRLPGRALPFGVPEAVLRRSLRESFAPAAPPPPGALDTLVALVRHGRGDRLLPRLIRYVEERRVHQARWTAGLVRYDGPLTLLWGEQDPIAVVDMAHHLVSLRPATGLRTFPALGHWPSLEAPDLVAEGILRLL